MDTNKPVYLGNYFGYTGHSFDGWVYDKSGISSPILACCCNGNVPKVVIHIGVVDHMYENREPRLYRDDCPTLRSGRFGLEVLDGICN